MGKNPFIDVSLAVKFLAHGGSASLEAFLEQRPEPDEESLRDACDNFMNDARRGEVEIISNGKAINSASLAGDNLFIDVERNSICTSKIIPFSTFCFHPSPEEERMARAQYLNEYLPSVEPWSNLKVLTSDVQKLKRTRQGLSSKDSIEEGAKKRKGRPSSRDEITNKLQEIDPKDPFWQCPRTMQADTIAGKCGKRLGSKGWGDRTVQNVINDFEKQKCHK